MLIRADLTHRCFIARIAIEDDLDQIVIFHAKPFSESLARRLKLRADDDSAQIKEDSPYAHVLFFVVAFLTLGDDVAAGVFLLAGFFALSAFGVAFAVGFGDVSAFGAGLDPSSATEAGSGVDAGAGAACCGGCFLFRCGSLSAPPAP